MEAFLKAAQYVEYLESRVRELELDNQSKSDQISRLSSSGGEGINAAKIVGGDHAKRAFEGTVESAEAKRKAQAAQDGFFPSIGDIVEKSNNDGGEEEEEEDAMDETGLRTTALGVTEIQSLCMKCEENGLTKLLMTKIPFFREVILMSFDCPHCGHRDVQIKPGGSVQAKGQKFTFTLTEIKDLSRQILKSDSCNLRIEELDFDIPPSRGVITNLEGMLSEAIDSLSETQERRMLVDGPDACEKVDEFCAKLKKVLQGEMFPLTVILDDPAGNSFVDNPNAPNTDPKLKALRYVRTPEQQEMLGLQMEDPSKDYKIGSKLPKALLELDTNFASQEVLQIPSPCPQCQLDGNAETCIVNLPFFKEVIIMAFNCEYCGFRDTEIKGGGAIPAQGRSETLLVHEPKVDLARDVIKSDTAGVLIPELDLELTRGSLGGMYTTVEGIVQKMRDNLFENRIFQGDAADAETKARFDKLEQQFDDCISGKMPFTLMIQDPLANSYIYSPYDPPETDPRLKTQLYDRSWEEDEELGLHDMNVDSVGFADVEDAGNAESVFQHLQAGQKDTHPNQFTQGGDS